MGNPEAAAVFFEPWSVLACNTEGAWEDFVAAVKKEPCCEDMEPTDADKKAVRLLKKHQAAIYAEFHRTLDSRPKTLTHGDMRADNMFRRKDGSGFTVIDWQTYGAAPPGVEMHQLFANQIDDLSLYASRHAGARPSSFAEQTLLRAGQAARAHARVPRRAAPAVPGGARVHLRYALGGFPDLRRNRVHVHGHRAWAGPSQTDCILPRARCQVRANARVRWGQVLIDLLTPEPPFHPNVVLFSKFFPRCRATYTQLDIAGIVIDTAARLGLED